MITVITYLLESTELDLTQNLQRLIILNFITLMLTQLLLLTEDCLSPIFEKTIWMYYIINFK